MIDFLICGQTAFKINLSVWSINGSWNPVISKTWVDELISEAVDWEGGWVLTVFWVEDCCTTGWTTCCWTGTWTDCWTDCWATRETLGWLTWTCGCAFLTKSLTLPSGITSPT